MKKNLTVRYCVTHFSYWAAYSSAAPYAATYLLDKGLSSSMVGILLAVAGVLAGLTQPILANYADQSKKFILPGMMQILSLLSILCFGVLLLPGWSAPAAGFLYLLGMWCSDAMISLLNALGVAYSEDGYTVNYGAGRGVGAVASGAVVLVLGHLIARLGMHWLFLLVILCRIVFMINLAGYPKLEKKVSTQIVKDESCGVWAFFFRYKWYCLSLIGIVFLSTFHVMTDSFMIAIMENLGGDSSHVGTALFIASIVGAPVIFFFSFFRKHFSDNKLLLISAFSYLAKAVLFCIAPGIGFIYVFQLLQISSYGFLAPVQVYYANAKVRQTDMVKGQAFVSAAYSLACSAGSLLGGVLLNFGVYTMLVAGVVVVLVGTGVLLLTINKNDIT